ncbi:hypothetical protein [Geothrix fermentans]|uniref:hypothetical protein n=1 Tax=Geothrix fermentans TaxID=44676 RepID=UPI000405766C|nr:hypothetical protein [Geothrix fermentans]
MAPRDSLIHLHCGDASALVHRRSGLPGVVRVCRDSPAVGPWTPDAARLPGLRAVWWGVAADEILEEPRLADLGGSSEPILWFGPDPWEQACLLRVLAELPEGTLADLVPLDRSVAQTPPSTLPGLFSGRVLLEEETLAQAREMWDGFLEGGWGSLTGCGLSALPWMARALARLAEDHPREGPGRTLTQIRGLIDQGVRELPALMAGLRKLEDPHHGAWYGDRFVAKMVDSMEARLG